MAMIFSFAPFSLRYLRIYTEIGKYLCHLKYSISLNDTNDNNNILNSRNFVLKNNIDKLRPSFSYVSLIDISLLAAV